jgi:hypothetical protein
LNMDKCWEQCLFIFLIRREYHFASPQLYNENNPASWLFLLFCVPAISWKLIGRNDYPYYLNLVRLKCIWSLDRGPLQEFMYDGGWGHAYCRS